MIHHVLSQRGFNPAGIIFPVSSVILDQIDEYRVALETYSDRLLPHINWQATHSGNVKVLNKTIDFYRYFDATPQTEFLFQCVHQTIETDLPQEAKYLKQYDAAVSAVMNKVEMPNKIAEKLVMFVRQNNGVLSKKRREHEYAALTDEEVSALEKLINDAFEENLTSSSC